MTSCNNYPKFEANQVLTAEQLNQAIIFLEKQERMTRCKLIGSGIACGFDLKVTPGVKPKIHLSKGCGITTEGYLIACSDVILTRYRKYKDPAAYSFFGNNNSQIELWELLPDVVEDEDETIGTLTTDLLKNKALILYIEVKEVDLASCTGDDCDEKGIRVELCVKKLLIKISDLRQIIIECYKYPKNVDLEDKINARFKLPEVSIGRSGNLINKT